MLLRPKLFTLVKISETFDNYFSWGKFLRECVSFALCSLATVSMTIDSTASPAVAQQLSSSQFHWKRDVQDEGCPQGLAVIVAMHVKYVY